MKGQAIIQNEFSRANICPLANISLQKFDMLFAQNYPICFMGMDLAYDKIFCKKIHRIGNVISIGQSNIRASLGLSDEEIASLSMFLKSLQVDFFDDIGEWLERRAALQWWEDLVTPMHYLHKEPKLGCHELH